MKNYFTVEVNGEIYCDYLGDEYRFLNANEAQEFIECFEIEGAVVTRQN